MYIILRHSEWFDCEDAIPETVIEPYGFTKLADAVKYIENELIPEDKEKANGLELIDEDLLQEVSVYGDKLNPFSYEACLTTKYADDGLRLREIYYSIQEIQVR